MTKKKGNLKEIALVFFRMGCFAFGGQEAHIAMMDEEIIQKRKWMSRQHFLDLIGATNLIPGPNSTEMTMHSGHERGGIPGLFVAGIAFILPAVVITGFLAYLYVEYGSLPDVKPFITGIKPAVLAVIAGAILKLGKKALKSWELGVLGGLVVITSLMPNTNEVLVLLCADFIQFKNVGKRI
jgi:chromate transporter